MTVSGWDYREFLATARLMGIRFQCPNGHKLNVKTDLAGKRASCPECGAKLVIPAVSLDESSDLSAVAIANPVSANSQSQLANNGASAPPVRASISSPTTPPLAGGGWYVRPTSGGQFGPATEELFCSWIAEGRVSADSHVWRDGWTAWKLARDAADDLPMPLAATPVAAVSPPIPAVPAADERQSVAVAEPAAESKISVPTHAVPNTLTASRYVIQRRQSRRSQLTLAIVMLAAVIVLAVVLIWVIRINA
jgi:hypothetical protein